MKKLFPLLCTAFLCAATLTSVAETPKHHTSNLVNDEERIVKNFNGIASGGPIEVIVKLGNTESIRFEGDADAISTLVTEVKSNILIIRPKNSWRSWSDKYEGKTIIAYVTAKNISSLTMSGSGSITVSTLISSSEMTTTLSGSGSIKVNLDVQELTSVLSGSGSLKVSGKANEANVSLSGSGMFSGKLLSVDNLSTKISGSGSVNIKAEKTINAVIVGSGNVNYSGNAAVEQRVIGSGSIRKV